MSGLVGIMADGNKGVTGNTTMKRKRSAAEGAELLDVLEPIAPLEVKEERGVRKVLEG